MEIKYLQRPEIRGRSGFPLIFSLLTRGHRGQSGDTGTRTCTYRVGRGPATPYTHSYGTKDRFG